MTQRDRDRLVVLKKAQKRLITQEQAAGELELTARQVRRLLRLEGRGETIYLIHMIDDASSELTARFVRHDSTAENMRVLRLYLEQHGRPVAFYTDKASLFQATPKTPRDRLAEQDKTRELPPTQIGRALRELAVVWIAAHSPQAKGRVERSFQTAQDRLVKGLRVAGATTLDQANRYLSEEFLPWWNQHLVVAPANPADAHRPVERDCNLDAVLSVVETRQVAADYTIRFQGRIYQIARADIRSGLRGSVARVEVRLDGNIHVRFQDKYLSIAECQPQPKQQPLQKTARPSVRRAPVKPTEAARQSNSGLSARGGMPVWKAAQIHTTRG